MTGFTQLNGCFLFHSLSVRFAVQRESSSALWRKRTRRFFSDY